MSEPHDCRFRLRGGPGTILFCEEPKCGAMRVVTFGPVRTLRRLTTDETINVLDHMIYATAVGQAMVVIHGQAHGMRRAREVLGYEAVTP